MIKIDDFNRFKMLLFPKLKEKKVWGRRQVIELINDMILDLLIQDQMNKDGE